MCGQVIPLCKLMKCLLFFTASRVKSGSRLQGIRASLFVILITKRFVVVNTKDQTHKKQVRKALSQIFEVTEEEVLEEQEHVQGSEQEQEQEQAQVEVVETESFDRVISHLMQGTGAMMPQLRLLSLIFFWPGLRAEVDAYCQRTKHDK